MPPYAEASGRLAAEVAMRLGVHITQQRVKLGFTHSNAPAHC
jgi:hypothetical protein